GQVEAALGADLEELVNWIGSGAVTAGWDGEQPYVGFLLEATDPAAAERRLAQLRALAELAAGDASSGISISSETVAGVEVTTLRMDDASTTDLPVAAAIQYAIRDERVIIGIGDRFVGNVLTLDPGASLAAGDRYASAVARFGGATNSGTFFVDLDGLRTTLESVMGADAEPMYGLVSPNLVPFDYVAGVSRVSGDRVVSRMELVLR
ncbi:MAG TPA: hypothetical protein VK838_02665, partial [Candidatus Limnocylindrales bacterium]|nr:hypothetical protein [Candidatus Limnocylindrales bacterium]